MNKAKGLKTGIEFMLMLCAMCFIISCASSNTGEESIKEEPIIDKADDQLGETSWQAFKAAVKSKNEAQLKAHCTEIITDFQALLFMLNELYVMRKMDEMRYSELETIEIDGEAYLQFYAEEIGVDEFGYEYGTSVTLHFIETENGLFLDRYSAAG